VQGRDQRGNDRRHSLTEKVWDALISNYTFAGTYSFGRNKALHQSENLHSFHRNKALQKWVCNGGPSPKPCRPSADLIVAQETRNRRLSLCCRWSCLEVRKVEYLRFEASILRNPKRLDPDAVALLEGAQLVQRVPFVVVRPVGGLLPARSVVVRRHLVEAPMRQRYADGRQHGLKDYAGGISAAGSPPPLSLGMPRGRTNDSERPASPAQ